MNVKKYRNSFVALSLLWAICAQGQHRFSSLLADPLFTAPEVMTKGVKLPGDSHYLDCPSSFNGPHDVDFKEPLALSVAVNRALCHHPQVRYSWAAIKLQAGALGETKAAYLPTVNGTISQLKNNTQDLLGVSPETSNTGRTKYFNLTWRLFDFGARAANFEVAHQVLKSALASHDATLQKLLGSVIGAYFDALTAQSAYTNRLQAVEWAQITLEATQRREKRGVAAVNDTLQAQTTLAKAQLFLNRAQGDLNKARSVLTYTMGLPAGTHIVLPDEVEVTSEERMADLAQWLDEAQAKHPAIAAARAQWASARAKVKVASRTGLPTLDYNQNYYENGYPNQGLNALGSRVRTIGLVLTIPFFDGFARTYKIRGAQAQEEQSLAQLQDTEHQIFMEIVKAHADAQSAFTNLNASHRLLQAAQAAVESSNKRYDKGAADILELMVTQNALTDALQERAKCVSDWRSSRLKLLAHSGVLGLQSIP